LRALIFDSSYDSFLGVVAYVRIMEGTISSNEKLLLVNSKINGLSKEIGIFTPDMKPIAELKAGEIGYIATGIKETEKAALSEIQLQLIIQILK